MDILNGENIGVKIIVGMAIVLFVVIVVVALQQAPEVQAPQVASQSPVNPAPSKENVAKQVQERIGHLKDVVAKNPAESRSALELARTLQDGHDLAGALRYYEIGLKADPKNLDARVDYSLCLYQSGKEEEAFAQNAIVLRHDALNAQALFNVGAIYGNRGMADSAAYYWKKLIASHPHNDLAQKAEQNLKQLVDKKPTL
jgi:cytochrome c-type biogenesis protein CcmH/NrfG